MRTASIDWFTTLNPMQRRPSSHTLLMPMRPCPRRPAETRPARRFNDGWAQARVAERLQVSHGPWIEGEWVESVARRADENVHLRLMKGEKRMLEPSLRRRLAPPWLSGWHDLQSSAYALRPSD